MSSTKAPFQTQSAVAGDRRSQRRRSAKPERPSRRRDLRGLWRTTLALIAPLPGLLMAAKIIVSPFGVRNDLADVLAGVFGDPAREQLAQWLGLAFSLTVLPAVVAVAWASRRRAPWFALVGGLLGVIGFSIGFTVPDVRAAALVAVQQGLDPTKVFVINEAVSATLIVRIASAIFIMASSTGLLLLGVAQWRARIGRRWLAVLLGLSGVAHLLPLGTAAATGAWLATGIGCMGASIGLLQSANDDFDLSPEGYDQSGAATARTSGRDARTAWRTLLAMAGPPLALYVAIARFLLPYDMSDAPEVIFQRLAAHPGYGMAVMWIGLVLGPTCIAGVVAVGWLSRRRADLDHDRPEPRRCRLHLPGDRQLLRRDQHRAGDEPSGIRSGDRVRAGLWTGTRAGIQPDRNPLRLWTSDRHDHLGPRVVAVTNRPFVGSAASCRLPADSSCVGAAGQPAAGSHRLGRNGGGFRGGRLGIAAHE